MPHVPYHSWNKKQRGSKAFSHEESDLDGNNVSESPFMIHYSYCWDMCGKSL